MFTLSKNFKRKTCGCNVENYAIFIDLEKAFHKFNCIKYFGNADSRWYTLCDHGCGTYRRIQALVEMSSSRECELAFRCLSEYLSLHLERLV